jgi:hypothetical protein
MQRKLSGIISEDFDVTGQLLITLFAFVKYLKKMGTNLSSASDIYRLQERAFDSRRMKVLHYVFIEFNIPKKQVSLIKTVYVKPIPECG